MLLNISLNNSTQLKEMTTIAQVDVVQEIVEGLRQGKRQYQEKFYKHFFPIMFPTAMQYGSSKEDAHEIINSAFLKVINTIDKYKDQNFGGWVRTIVKRTAIDHCRKFSFGKVQTVEIMEIDETTYNHALSNLHVEEILKLLQQLPPASRTVFNLFVFEDLSHDEIATKLSISKGTSKWHVSNARKLLFDLIKTL